MQDTTAPTWDQALTGTTIELGTPYSYDTNASDLAVITYYINDTTNFAINSGTGVITNNTALSVGSSSAVKGVAVKTTKPSSKNRAVLMYPESVIVNHPSS